MISLCQEHRLEHRTKHIALQHFLVRELQQHGHLRLAYVATRVNIADIFTKALPPGDHQRFPTVLGLLALLVLTGLVTAYPLPPQGLAPSGVSQVDPPPLVEPLEVSFYSSCPAEGGDPAGDDTVATRRSPRLETPPGFPPRPSSPPPQPAAVDSRAENDGAEPGGAETGGEGSKGAATGVAATGGAGLGGAAIGGAGSWGDVTEGADSGGCWSPSGGGAVGDPVGGVRVGQPPQPDLLETLSSQAIRAWIVPRGSPGGGGGTGGTGGAGGAAGARGAEAGGTRGAGAAGPEGARTGGAGAAGAGGAVRAGGAGAAGPRGARTRGTGAAGAGGAAGAVGAGGVGGATGATSTGGAGGTTGARGPGDAGASGAASAGGAGSADGAAGAGGAGVAGARGAGATGTALRIPFFYPQPQSSLPPPDSVLRQVLSLPSSTGLPLPLLCPPTDQSQPQLLPGSPLPTPTPHIEVTESLTEQREPETRASTLVHARRVAHPRPPAIPSTYGMALHLARAASPTVTRLLATDATDPDLETTAAFALVTELVDFTARSRLDYLASLVTKSESVCPPSAGDALDIPTSRSYADAIAGEYSSQWQTAMDADMASWKSTGTYVDEVPPPGANIVDGTWIFRVKRPSGSPPAFKARYVARGFSQRQGVDYFQTFSPTPTMTTLRVLLHVAAQRDYELHSVDFSTAFLQGSLHEEI
ncbi:unnamed protein product [Closterium sp. NIES-53]